MAKHYKHEIERLHEALSDEQNRDEAVDIIRTLIDRILLTPFDQDGRKTLLAVDLRDDLAGILDLAAQTKKPPQKDGFPESTKLVAGARNLRLLLTQAHDIAHAFRLTCQQL